MGRKTKPRMVAILSAVVGVLALAGCGKEDTARSTTGNATASVEVRGEPIRGEPIVAPAPAAPVPSVSESAAKTETAVTPASPRGVLPGVELAKPSGVPAVAAETADQPLAVGFDKLASFQYTVPEGPVDTNAVAQAGASQQIPETIKALNNRLISLKGFMLPLKVEKGLVTELLIMRDQSMCCYGTVPKINEWVSVKMVGGGVKPIMDQAVTLFGKLKVGEMFENGYLVGIYALDGDRMAGPLDL